jgi:hypothetical protein
MTIFGKDVNVEALVNGVYVTIGCATTISFEFENELIARTDVNAGLNRKKRVRLSDSRGSVQGLTMIENTSTRLTAFHFLQEAVRRSEQDMRFVFMSEDGDSRVIAGKFLVQALSLTGDHSGPGFSEFDLRLEGTGGITIGTVDSPGDDSGLGCPDMDSDTWVMEEGQTSISGLGQEGKSFAGREILEVDVEGLQYDYKDGAPGNREYAYNGTEISVEIPAPEGGQRVFVIWKTFSES